MAVDTRCSIKQMPCAQEVHCATAYLIAAGRQLVAVTTTLARYLRFNTESVGLACSGHTTTHLLPFRHLPRNPKPSPNNVVALSPYTQKRASGACRSHLRMSDCSAAPTLNPNDPNTPVPWAPTPKHVLLARAGRTVADLLPARHLAAAGIRRLNGQLPRLWLGHVLHRRPTARECV